jgi:SsrA-binding protein
MVTVRMKQKSDIKILNKRARFEYIILDRYTAGIVLYGTEIKSIREGKASLVDSYCAVEHGEMYVKQMHIAEYRFGSYANHDAKRDRKLLLQRREIRKLEKATKDNGKTIIPLELFINDRGLAKMEIALCQGKHTYDKRQSLREADDKRELSQALKSHR